MFNILHDSIFNPKGLVKQVNRSGWFIFLYLIVMAIFMSLGSFVAYFSYDNSLITSETTGCSLVNHELVCDGENYDLENMFYIYGTRVFFLDKDASITDLSDIGESSIIIQGDSVTLYFNNSPLASEALFSTEYGILTFEEGITTLENFFLITSIVTNLLSNLFLIIMIILISTLMFIRYRKEIKYRKIFKLVTFAVTPVALLITFYNLLQFDSIIFFVLAFFAYRTLFNLNRQLYIQILSRKYAESQQNEDVIESIDHDDVDSQDVFEDEDDDNDEDDTNNLF